MSLLPGVVFLSLCLQADPTAEAPTLAARVAHVLTRVEAPDTAAIDAGARELLRLGDVSDLLLESLGTGRAPGEDGDGALLTPGQRALLLAAIERLGSTKSAIFVADAARDPRSAIQVAAALRLMASGTYDVHAMLALARAAEASGLESGVDEALEESLSAALARSSASFAAVESLWKDLGPVAASSAVRALEHQGGVRALDCLRSLLGRRAEYDACLLVAIGNSLANLPAKSVETLARDFERYLHSVDSAQAQAAAIGLGRLACPSSVPALIECLGDDRPLARTALTALRTCGSVSLPGSASLWRNWYGLEESWWQERAPVLLESLENAEAEGRTLADLVVIARELSEHPLHRDDLVAGFRPMLMHADPGVRGLACQTLERLDTLRAVPPLRLLLADEDPSVVAAARDTLERLFQRHLPPDRRTWQAYLREHGLVDDDSVARVSRPPSAERALKAP